MLRIRECKARDKRKHCNGRNGKVKKTVKTELKRIGKATLKKQLTL